MTKPKQIILIACLMLIAVFSYAKSEKKNSITDLPPLNKLYNGPPGPRNCIHRSYTIGKHGNIIYGNAYAYAIVYGMEPCPEFSNEYENSYNIISEIGLQGVEWGALAVPITLGNVHTHCNVPTSTLITKPCVDGNCVLPSACTTTLITDALKTISPLDHCNVGNGDPY